MDYGLKSRIAPGVMVVSGLLMTGVFSVAGAAPLMGPEMRRSEGMPSANRGQSSSMVFSGPEIAPVMAAWPDWARPEFGRNDTHLSYRQPQALTAIDEWPQPAPPSFDRYRRTTLSRSAETIIIFQRPGYQHGTSRFGPGYNRRHFSPLPR